MTVPGDKKDQAVYHMILSEMHRLQGLMLNLQTIGPPETAKGLQDHFTRDQNLTLGKLMEWKQRRPEIYQQAGDDFAQQKRQEEP